MTHRGFREFLIVSALAAAGVALSACAPTASSTSSTDPGAALVERKCTVCHTIERINQADKNTAGWNLTVDRMRAKGAVVSSEEQAQIVAYLSGK